MKNARLWAHLVWNALLVRAKRTETQDNMRGEMISVQILTTMVIITKMYCCVVSLLSNGIQLI